MRPKLNPDQTVRLLDGRSCKFDKVIAYCHNLNHVGFINKALLKEHQCIEKQCTLLEKHDLPYWNALQKQKRDRQKRYAIARQRKMEITARDSVIRGVFAAYADRTYVTSISEKGKLLIITYIYDEHIDLGDLISILRKELCRPIYLRAVRSDENIRAQLIRRQEQEG